MKELIEKIDNEMSVWNGEYSRVDVYLYPMIAACFRAKATFTIEEKVKITEIFQKIDHQLMSIEDDSECLNAIYSTVVSYTGDSFVKQLEETGKGKIPVLDENGIPTGEMTDPVFAEMTVEEALMAIEEQLVARQKISDESLIRLQTLQWVKDQIKEA